MAKTPSPFTTTSDLTTAFENWHEQWSTSVAPPAQALQDWVKRCSALPLAPGQEPLTVLGDYLKVGDIKNAVAVALGRGAQAKAEDVQQHSETVTGALVLVAAQLENVARQLAALTERLDSVDERFAAREATVHEAGENGSHA